MRKETLGQELDRANFIFYGYASNPRLNTQPGALPGSGATDFHVERVVKSDPALGNSKVLTLERYLPVLNPADPPRFLVFCNVSQGKLDPYLGRQTKSSAVVDYLIHARDERARGKAAALLYYAKFLDHPDELIAEDAFLEFARSGDEEVGQVAKKLSPALFRTLLQNPKLDADRLSLFAFLLGNCGGAADADLLRKRIELAGADDLRALDGLLGGYIALRPTAGWKLARDILSNPHANFLKKFAALRTVRFYMGWQPSLAGAFMIPAYQLAIPDGEMADLAIEDLRRWKMWSLTTLILAQYGKPTHDAPIVKRGILRYALCCPLPEAQHFLDRVRGRDGELIRELAESLEFEKKSHEEYVQRAGCISIRIMPFFHGNRRASIRLSMFPPSVHLMPANGFWRYKQASARAGQLLPRLAPCLVDWSSAWSSVTRLPRSWRCFTD